MARDTISIFWYVIYRLVGRKTFRSTVTLCLAAHASRAASKLSNLEP
jgi:hypothetical protein